MFGRDPWGGPLEISNADSATDDDRSRDLDRAALMRQLDETQQSWLLAGPGDRAGKKKKKYVDLGCVVLDRKIFMWTVGTILGLGVFIGFIMMIVKLVPHKRPPPPPPDQYTQALHKALMFFNAQRCECCCFPAFCFVWGLAFSCEKCSCPFFTSAAITFVIGEI